MSSDDPLIPRKSADTVSRNRYLSLSREDRPPISHQSTPSSQQGFFKQFFSTSGPPQIFAVSFLITFAYGNIIAVLPKIATQRFARVNYGYAGEDCNSFENYGDKPEACLMASVDAQNAHALSELIANSLTLVTGSLIGSISDTHGRRGFFVLGTFVAVLGNFAFLFVCLNQEATPWVFYGIRSLHGLINWTSIALATLADVMPPTLRAPAVGMLMSGYWIGLCTGPTVAVFAGFMHAAVFSCFVALTAIFVAVLFVPETLNADIAAVAVRQREQTHVDRSLLGRFLWNMARPWRELLILNRDSFFRLVSMLVFFNGMVTSGDKILLLYYVDSKLSFTMADTAIMLLLFGIGAAICQAIILKPLNDCIGERLIVIVCFATAVVSNTIYGVANSRGTLYAGIILGSVTGMAFPTFSAIKANNVGESEQGRIQGALYSLLALASGVGPVILRGVDELASGSFLGPGAMFIFAACLQLVAACFACRLPEDRSNSKKMVKVEAIDTAGAASEEMVVL